MTKRPTFRHFKTSPSIIRPAALIYVRFPLSLRSVEGLLHERCIEISQMKMRACASLNDINGLRVDKVGQQSRPLRHLELVDAARQDFRKLPLSILCRPSAKGRLRRSSGLVVKGGKQPFKAFCAIVCSADFPYLRPVATTAASGPYRPIKSRRAKARLEPRFEVPRDRPMVCYCPMRASPSRHNPVASSEKSQFDGHFAMPVQTITVELTDCAATHDSIALIVPLGIDTEFQRFQSFEAPKDWGVTIVAEPRSGQRAAVLEPPARESRARLLHTFTSSGSALPADAYRPEGTAVTTAAGALANEARSIATLAGGGLPGIAAIVADTNARFEYGEVPVTERWYHGQDAVPIVACTAGNCIDINTYLTASFRAANYEAAYLTCYFFDDNPDGIASGMHCWVRTRHDGVIQDWDITHFKKAGRSDISAMLNPVPGQRFALAYGRDHVYPWLGIDIRLSTPSRPMWVREDGTAIWGEPPVVRLA